MANEEDASASSASIPTKAKFTILNIDITSTTLPQPLVFFISNLKSLIPVKLESTNYAVWKTLAEAALQANHLLPFVQGKIPCPAKSSNENEEGRRLTSMHLLNSILSRISPTILPVVRGLTTISSVWTQLETRFVNITRSHIHKIQTDLSLLRQNSKTMAVYIEEIESILDQLSLASFPINEQSVIIQVIEGLSEDYDNLGQNLRTRNTDLSLDELFTILKSEESYKTRHKQRTEAASVPNVAFNTYKSQNQNVKSNFRNQNYRGFRNNITTYQPRDSRSMTRIPHNNENRNHASAPCVFLGYHLSAKGYRCYNLETGVIHTFRHIKFVENVFPFHTKNSGSNITESSVSSPPVFYPSFSSPILSSTPISKPINHPTNNPLSTQSSPLSTQSSPSQSQSNTSSNSNLSQQPLSPVQFQVHQIYLLPLIPFLPIIHQG